MKIKTNETNLDAKKLQQLFSLVHKVVAKYEGRLRWWKRLKVHMSYYRGMGYHCKATLGGTNIWMRMCIVSYNDVERVSQVFAHELYHSYGYNHKGFRRFPLDEKQMAIIKKRFPNMDGFIKPVVEKPKADVIVLRYKRMVANKRLWEKKLKFSSTKYKKYTKLVKTYEKKYPERIASVRG